MEITTPTKLLQVEMPQSVHSRLRIEAIKQNKTLSGLIRDVLLQTSLRHLLQQDTNDDSL